MPTELLHWHLANNCQGRNCYPPLGPVLVRSPSNILDSYLGVIGHHPWDFCRAPQSGGRGVVVGFEGLLRRAIDEKLTLNLSLLSRTEQGSGSSVALHAGSVWAF